MKERFKRLPEALQKQVIYRLGAGVIFLLCTILILIFFRDIYLLLPALCFAIFFILNGLWVFFETDAGKYVVIEGRCTGIEKTPLRKRIKNIHIETDDIIRTPDGSGRIRMQSNVSKTAKRYMSCLIEPVDTEG